MNGKRDPLMKETKAELVARIRGQIDVIAKLNEKISILSAPTGGAFKSYMIPPEVVKAYFTQNPAAPKAEKPEVIRAWAISNGLITGTSP